MQRLGLAFAALICLGFLSPLEAAPLTAPAGLAPGTPFRFIFLTPTTTAATSTDIASYNSFVQAQASGATFAGATVNWRAIGSTATVDARDNVGGYGTSVPVYLVTGTRVANNLTTSAGGIWGGSLLASANVRIDGSATTRAITWTGSSANGTNFPSETLGTLNPRRGDANLTSAAWLDSRNSSNAASFFLYAVSEELVVPPDPTPVPTLSEWALVLMLVMLMTVGWNAQRKTG